MRHIQKFIPGKLFAYIKKAVYIFSGDNISVYAAQTAFFMIISALPFLMLILGTVKYFLPGVSHESGFVFRAFLPEQTAVLLDKIIYELYNGKTLPVVSTAAAGVIWSASRGVLSLISGLDSIYKPQKKRSFIKSRLTALMYTAVFTLIITGTLVLFVAGKYIIKITGIYYPQFFAKVLYLAMLTILFASVYKYLSGKHIPFRYHMPGALLAASGWIIFTVIYSFYIDNFTNYSYIYGSLTAIVFLMLWLYFCMNIFLFGAKINEYLHKRRKIT